jgi:hypothetical protein
MRVRTAIAKPQLLIPFLCKAAWTGRGPASWGALPVHAALCEFGISSEFHYVHDPDPEHDCVRTVYSANRRDRQVDG